MDLTKRLRKVIRHMPGFYDLLPFYRCVDEGTTAHWLRPGANEDLEGDSGLATESLDRHNRLIAGDTCGTSCRVFDALIRGRWRGRHRSGWMAL